MRPAYYNEIDPYAAQWLRNLIAAGHLPAGDVDTRSITDVRADDLAGYGQCHFFAGIGGWALAARLAGWPDSRPLWTGSCPCQPFSVAGKHAGTRDDRHLWPDFFRLIRSCRPAVVMGEQVAAAVGKDWLDGVFDDLEGIDYACEAAIAPACAVNAPHRRDRLWFVSRSSIVGHGHGQGLAQRASLAGVSGAALLSPARQEPADAGQCSAVEHADFAGAGKQRQQRGGQLGGAGCDPEGGIGDVVDDGMLQRPDAGSRARHPQETGGRFEDPGAVAGLGSCAPMEYVGRGRHGDADEAAFAGRDGAFSDGSESAWSGAGWVIGHDGKARRVEPSIYPLAHGIPARVGRLRAYGNAIVPEEAAQVIGAYLDMEAEKCASQLQEAA